MSNLYSNRREEQPDFVVGINLPMSAYLQMSTGLVIVNTFSSTEGQYSGGQMREAEQLWRRIVLLSWFIVNNEFFPADHTIMKAPLKIMHRLTDQLSLFKVRVFIKIDRLTGRYFEVLPLPWPLQKGNVRLAILDVSLWSDKHSLRLLLFKPYQGCDLN